MAPPVLFEASFAGLDRIFIFVAVLEGADYLAGISSGDHFEGNILHDHASGTDDHIILYGNAR